LALIRWELFPGVLTPLPQGGAFNGEWYRNQQLYGLPGIEGYMTPDDGKTLVHISAAIDDYGGVLVIATYGPADDFAVAGEGGLVVADSVVVFR